MVKAITSGCLAAAASQYGVESVILLQVDWSAGTRWYADKNITVGPINAEGRISSLGAVASQKKQDSIGIVTNIDVTLTDDDGALKAVIDASNVEYTPVTVWQWFVGTAASDLSKLFKGSLAGPVEWGEGNRSLKFAVETRLKDQEIGFSIDYIPPADPTNIYASPNPSVPFVNPEAVDRAWPLGFGSVVHVPALLIETASRGYLKYPFRGPRDISQPPTSNPYQDDTHFYLVDGDGAYFPQDTPIDVDVDGYIFRGILHQDTFTVTDPYIPRYENVFFGNRDTNDPDNILANVAWLQIPAPSIVNNWCLYQDEFGGSTYFRCIRQEQYYDTIGTLWCKVEFDTAIIIPASGSLRLLGAGDKIAQVAKHGLPGWSITGESFTNTGLNGQANPARVLMAADVLSRVAWRINAGAEVRLWKPFRKDVFVANLIPSKTLIAVYAERTNKEGVKELVPIPPSYYTTTNVSPTGPYTPFTVTNVDGPHTLFPTLVTLDPPLREYEGQKWGEQIYVTYKSTQGPNTSTDVIKWIFDTYSLIPTDGTSFSSVASAIANYPSHFVLFDKYNVIDICEQIAWQARLGLIVDDGQVAIKYLSHRPSTDVTYGDANFEFRSVALGFTSTEEIYTELRAQYKLTYYSAKRYQREYVYKGNIDKYGLRRRKIDFFIYNIPWLVQKSMTFWGFRMTNSWRKVRGKVQTEALQLEVFDCVGLDFTDSSLLNGNPISLVDAYSYDTNPLEGSVSLELWLPYLAGETAEASGAFLSDVGDVFPADPTDKYLPNPHDFQLADEESKFRVISKIIADSSPQPAIVTSIVPNLGS